MLGVVVVCLHGAFRVPEDLFLDEQDTSQTTGFRSFLGGPAVVATVVPVMSAREGDAVAEETKKSNHVQRKIEKRQKDRKLDAHIEEQFGGGRLLACISSRPGQ
ncbi:hypothetical protein V8G54_019819 [Vigna mungo]|uniref:Uncharacterized protein n=1 Tax=Vigna mungo TaxID=3915 RepID=A0AAQ3NEE1_VIGMU